MSQKVMIYIVKSMFKVLDKHKDWKAFLLVKKKDFKIFLLIKDILI